MTSGDRVSPCLTTVATLVCRVFKPRFMPEDSPGFFITGTRDWLVPVSSTRADADKLRKQGVLVEVHAPEGAEHGFGVGNGTPAEGWISQAIDFWKRNMK